MTVDDSDRYSRLIEAFQSLALQQQQTESNLNRLREEVQELRTRVEQQETPPRVETPIAARVVEAGTTEQSSTTDIQVGDRVVLKNKGRARSDTGVVTGITLGGFLRITLENGQKVRRLPKNVEKHE